MATVASSRTVLLLHDGELKDIQTLVEELGAQCVGGVPDNPAEIDAFDLVVVTPRHLQELPGRTRVRRKRAAKRATRVAVIQRESKTLAARIQRTGIDVLVKRPVHPRALRLLLLHKLYRGPERRARRIPVGTPVRFRVGLRTREAILADLSTSGCQLLTSTELAVGQIFTLYLKRKGVGRLFGAKVRVVRLAPAETPGETTVAASFVSTSRGARQRIQAVMDAFKSGPAALPTGRLPEPGEPDEEPLDEVDECIVEEEIPEIILGPELIVVDELVPTRTAEAPPESTEDRREETRRRFDRRVVALGDQAARVMVGRDLSTQGMRIDGVEGLGVGDSLTIALHAAAGETPLVVPAEVMRDDVEGGLVLTFGSLDESARVHLAKIVDSLPALDEEADAERPVVMSEILASD